MTNPLPKVTHSQITELQRQRVIAHMKACGASDRFIAHMLSRFPNPWMWVVPPTGAKP
jgi:hypothetical protein